MLCLTVCRSTAPVISRDHRFLPPAGFAEYLLDRSTESSKEGRDAKYAVVAALVSSRGSSQLPADLRAQLTTYHEQGAFYIRAQTEVALEESS